MLEFYACVESRVAIIVGVFPGEYLSEVSAMRRAISPDEITETLNAP